MIKISSSYLTLFYFIQFTHTGFVVSSMIHISGTCKNHSCSKRHSDFLVSHRQKQFVPVYELLETVSIVLYDNTSQAI